MCSVLTASLTRMRNKIFLIFLALLAVLSLLGVFLSRAAMQGIRRILMGYQPEEFQKLYIERTEVMKALEEGIVAINQDQKVIMTNKAARNILKIPEDVVTEGAALSDLFPDTRLVETLNTGKPEYNMNQMIQKQTILASRIPIIHKGEIIGAVAGILTVILAPLAQNWIVLDHFVFLRFA